MNNNQLKLAILKTGVAMFAMIGVFGMFQALRSCEAPQPNYAIKKAVYHYEEPIDRYHDTTLSYGQRMVYNSMFER